MAMYSNINLLTQTEEYIISDYVIPFTQNGVPTLHLIPIDEMFEFQRQTGFKVGEDAGFYLWKKKDDK